MAGHVSAYAFTKAYLATLGYEKVYREAPANATSTVPFHVVARFGGGKQVVTVDLPRIDIDTFASSEDVAEQIASDLDAKILTAMAGFMHGGSVVLRTRTIVSPRLLPWDATGNVYRVGASYELRLHRYLGVN
jgi:hypothetical protein